MSKKIISDRKFSLPADIANPIYDRRYSVNRGNAKAVDVFPEGLVVREIVTQYHYGPESEFWLVLPGSSRKACIAGFSHDGPLHAKLVEASRASQGPVKPETVEQAAAFVCGGDEELFLKFAVEKLLKRGELTVEQLIKAYHSTTLVP